MGEEKHTLAEMKYRKVFFIAVNVLICVQIIYIYSTTSGWDLETVHVPLLTYDLRQYHKFNWKKKRIQIHPLFFNVNFKLVKHYIEQENFIKVSGRLI